MASLGRLERVELREAWDNEATAFTPWLSGDENIALLGEAIGIELEVEAQEKSVGPFKADILCKDTADDHFVLIENQLERTDHKHLGQLLTYAAGLHAVTIVWIADRFTEEHRAAIDWLNEITSSEFHFFGLEIELWKIGDSPIAPKFNIVCKPNDWTADVSRVAQSITSGELTETNVSSWNIGLNCKMYLLRGVRRFAVQSRGHSTGIIFQSAGVRSDWWPRLILRSKFLEWRSPLWGQMH